MKKMIAMLLALCVMAMMIPAMAEESSTLSTLLGMVSAAKDDGEGMDLNGLLGAVGGENAEGGLGAIAGMLGALGGTDASAKPTYTAVPAESIEQFYGTWAVSKAAVGGMEIPMEMLSMLGIKASGEITVSENSISASASYSDGSSDEPTAKEAAVEVEMALVDGALNVTYEGETVAFQLTDAGELVCDVEGIGAIFFTHAA